MGLIPKQLKRTRHRHAGLLLCVLLCGCATPRYAPQVPAELPSSSAAGQEIALRALSMIGAPYAWGGHGPHAFDCSGLVHFIHRQLGVEVPRTAAEQFDAAERVHLSELTPGDLLFFRIKGRSVSHVAIYAGEGRFVHAPQTGRPVELRPIDDAYYRSRLAGVGRFVD